MLELFKEVFNEHRKRIFKERSKKHWTENLIFIPVFLILVVIIILLAHAIFPPEWL